MPAIAWVALGGAIGSAARFGVNVWSGRVLGDAFPWHTLIVNIAGCFAMGVLTALLAFKIDLPQHLRLFLTTGVLGGFTTFSAFALDFALLVERKALGAAVGYAGASVAGALVGVFAGLALVRALSA